MSDKDLLLKTRVVTHPGAISTPAGTFNQGVFAVERTTTPHQATLQLL